MNTAGHRSSALPRLRFFIINNPSSGTAGRKRVERVIRLLQDGGALVNVRTTSSHGEGCEQARAAALTGRHDAIIAAGGDGTIHDVACGLTGQSCPLGIIPAGTANVFAREAGLDFSPAALAQMLQRGPVQTISPGMVNNEPFLFVVGVGFDAAAVRYFESGNHRRFGLGGLVPPVLAALIHDTGARLDLTVDGARLEASWVIVTRTRHYAGNILLAPDANPGDDRLHVVIFSGKSALVRMRQLAAMLTGLIEYDPGVERMTARHVTIRASEPVPVQIDGEAKGQLPLDLSIHPGRLHLICPPFAKARSSAL